MVPIPLLVFYLAHAFDNAKGPANFISKAIISIKFHETFTLQ